MAGAAPMATSAAEIGIEFSLDRDTTTSAGVFSPDGQRVRELWRVRKHSAGMHFESWDGLDDIGRNVPPGAFQVRIVACNATYSDVGTIGNSGQGQPMQAGTDDLIVDRKNDYIYTANNWEEAGQDFRGMYSDGAHRMDAKFRVRNGTPNGWPIAVAIEDGTLYCSVYTVNETVPGVEKKVTGGAVIRKFSAENGEPIQFPTETGYIRVKMPDPADTEPFEHQSLRSIAICGDAIVVADRFTNKVSTFNKNSGDPIGEFAINGPESLIADSKQRLWIAHDKSKVSVTDLAGKSLAEPEVAAKEIAEIRLDAENHLWVADQEAGEIQVYGLDSFDAPSKLTKLKSFGHKAKPGEFEPLAIGHIQSFDILSAGDFVLAQTYGHGSIVTRFSQDSKVIWQQVGLEFCTNGTYDQQQPDLFISSLSNAYRLTDRQAGQWRFEGCMHQGVLNPKQSTGTPRIVEIEGKKFYFVLTGDQVQIFRLEGQAMLASAIVGLSQRSWDEKLLGPLLQAERPIHHLWRDTNGDHLILPEEVERINDPKTQISAMSCEVDAKGNLIIPNHVTNAIHMLPLAKLDEQGNPIYDWTSYRELIPKDDTLRNLRPMKACPLPNGGMYVLQQADTSFYPPIDRETGYGKPHNVAWMGGWVYSKYNSGGTRLFTVALPDHCTGMDWIPNVGRTEENGVVVGCYDAMKLYHYSKDGLLIEVIEPTHKTGWLDHNGSISINRNPADGLIDLFAEESLCNRISWYRMDDRAVTTIKVNIVKNAEPEAKYSSESEFYEALHASQEKSAAKEFPIVALQRALAIAVKREEAPVRAMLAQAFAANNQLDKAIEQLELVAAAPEYDADKRAEALFLIALWQQQLKNTDAAIQTLQRIKEIKSSPQRHDAVRAIFAIAAIYQAAGDDDAALKQFQSVKDFYRDAKEVHPEYYRQAYVGTGQIYQKRKQFDQAITEFQKSLELKGVDESNRTRDEMLIGECYASLGQLDKAIEHFVAGVEAHPKAHFTVKLEALLRAGDLQLAAGRTDAARNLYEQARAIPDLPPENVQQVQNKLAGLPK